MSRSERTAAASALAAPTVGLAGIALAIALTPGFDPATDALPDLGVPTAPAPWTFDGGLILGGLLALPFAAWRTRTAETPLSALAGAVFAAAALAMTGVGVFPAGTDLHLPCAVTFYLLTTATLCLDGLTRIYHDDVSGGLKRVAAAVVHVTAWTAWALYGDALGVPGLALPEPVGALAVAWWSWTALPSSDAPVSSHRVRRPRGP